MQQVKVKLIYETSLILLALTSVLFLVFDLSYQPVIDKVIWAVFFIDVIIRITISKNKWGYIKTHPLDLVAAIPLGGMFQMARLARLLMVLRVFAISKNYFKTFFKCIENQ